MYEDLTTPERRHTREKDVEDDSGTPDIDLFAIGTHENFWGYIIRASHNVPVHFPKMNISKVNVVQSHEDHQMNGRIDGYRDR